MRNLPAKIETGIFFKIKLLLRKIFSKKDYREEKQETYNEQCANDNKYREEFVNRLKVENEKAMNEISKRTALIKMIEANPNILDNLEIEQLEDIEKYYDDKINLLTKRANKLSS